ncbi:MAG: hypothetical protein QXP58_08240, partial [Thermoprotei archaeon]
FIGSSGPVSPFYYTTAVQSNSTGGFSTTFSVPLVPFGDYTVLAVATNTSGTYGASAPFQVVYELAPELTQWDSSFKPGGKPLYSVLAGQAGLNLSFFGFGLPLGTVKSVTFYNSAGQVVSMGFLPPTTVAPNGEFSSTQNAANVIPDVNVTIAGALPPGVGYYAVFVIGGVTVKSEPFIASVPTNGLLKACMSPVNNPYTCTTSANSSGSINTLVQGYGFGANDPVTISIVNGAVTLVSQSTTADPNGAVYQTVSSGTTHFPEQTANVVAVDHLANGNQQKLVGTYRLIPQFTVTDTSTGMSMGFVGDTLTLTGLSFPAPFEATSVTFTSMSNQYTVTLKEDTNGNSFTIYYSLDTGDFPGTSSGGTATLNVLLPELPGGNTTVTINGATTAGAPVSITTYFWVESKATAAYYVNLPNNEWAPFATPQNLFAGDIIDLQVTGYPVNTQATVNFTAKTLTSEATNIMGSKALSNGTLELILYVPNVPASTQSGFGPYTIVLNGASSNGMLGKTIKTGFSVNVLLPGQYSTNPPHVYVNPQNIKPESIIGSKAGVFPTAYPVGTPLTIVGVGFTGSAKEYVYISATVSGSTTYQLFNTVNTSIYGNFMFTMSLPNESSYVYVKSSNAYKSVTYSIVVDQYNPSAIVQSPSTSTPTSAEAVPFNVVPAITLTPDQGTPNTTITVVGTGWASGESVSIYMQTFTIVPPGVAMASSNGFFKTTFSVPAFAPGPVTVVAKGSSSVTNATAPFTVESTVPPTKPTVTASLSAPSTASVNGTVLLTLTVAVNGTAYSVPLSDISGSILEPNGVSVPLSFLSVGTGQYQYLFHVPNIPGTYAATVTVTYDGVTANAAASFYVSPPTTIPPSNTSSLSSALSSISSAVSGLQSQLTSLENSLTTLSSQVNAALTQLGSSLSSLFNSVNSHVSTAETYSLGALVIAFIALIVIIYGVFVRRMP